MGICIYTVTKDGDEVDKRVREWKSRSRGWEEKRERERRGRKRGEGAQFKFLGKLAVRRLCSTSMTSRFAGTRWGGGGGAQRWVSESSELQPTLQPRLYTFLALFHFAFLYFTLLLPFFTHPPTLLGTTLGAGGLAKSNSGN
ncbi:hypothetical protein BO99DRAFT_44166 [Aspergillus violaceofuscus CBS 115571]|uniref:Uncharacterized protein n=1 Tax=Aspergillus violaceofuscus (strain CBS 115571) TaxID=1450538 RepID=A0A2V5HKT9_ASPV1|nr:hypothetical protein BO99DRAFT_44166 [Aspergillus violaceofuscus CBS 115571]